jgi:hypothetical protein
MDKELKEFAPYEQALALKELGFDGPCFGYYIDNKFEFFADVRSCNTNSEFGFYPTAPTFSQAFRWFRNKYNVHMTPSKFDETKWWVNWGTWSSRVFDTFEEAELACLDKLIEIAESE